MSQGDVIAAELVREGLRAEVLHTDPEKLNVWDPSGSVWKVTSFIGPFKNSTQAEVKRILNQIRPQ